MSKHTTVAPTCLTVSESAGSRLSLRWFLAGSSDCISIFQAVLTALIDPMQLAWFLPGCSLSLSLSLTHTLTNIHTHTLSLSHTLTHTHTHTHFLSRTHTHNTQTFFLFLSDTVSWSRQMFAQGVDTLIEYLGRVAEARSSNYTHTLSISLTHMLFLSLSLSLSLSLFLSLTHTQPHTHAAGVRTGRGHSDRVPGTRRRSALLQLPPARRHGPPGCLNLKT